MNLIIRYCLAFVLFTNLIFADDIQKTNVACNIDAISSIAGFQCNIYQFTSPQTNHYSDPSFYAEGYKSAGSLVGSASNIVDLDFNLPGGDQTLYDIHFDSSNYAIEYTGYFKGMF